MELSHHHTVSLILSSIIKPVSPSPQPSLFLSASDLLCRRFPYNRRILFYRLNPQEYPSLISTLKRSLSIALAHFYPFAGRLREREDGRLHVECNDMGAEFAEAAIHGVSFSELEKSSFDMQPFFLDLTRWAAYTLNDEGSAPLLSIQITQFACGSIALGVAHSHVIADGVSLWHFMSSWAECARGEPLSVPPMHTRNLLMVEDPSRKNAGFDLESLEEEEGNIENRDKKTKQRVFYFSKEMVDKLKEKAGGRFSSYEVLCAHIWKCASKARGHASGTRIGFISVANMRAKMEPPLPAGYFGNVLLWGMATTTAGELQEEDLGTTATRMRAAVATCVDWRMRGLLHLIERGGAEEVISKVLLNGARMRVSSSPKFPVFATDFGWGRPLAARSVVVEENGKVVFYPAHGAGLGNIDVCMSLPLKIMQRLENDPSFLACHVAAV